MSANYKCDFCGAELPEKNKDYSEAKWLDKKVKNKDETMKFIAVITLGPGMGGDACNGCLKEMRNKFVKGLDVL